MAAERAVLARMGVLTDPFADGMLTRLWIAFVNVVSGCPRRWRPGSVTRAGLAARVLWHDRQVTNALDAGVTQVVVVGAGYDSRAWRFRRPGVEFFELDHPGTQHDKARRAPTPAPTYVEVDLDTQSAAEQLVAHGLDASCPALFILEGVTMYLTEETVRNQLGELVRASAAGSRIAVDFYPPADVGSAQDRRLMRWQRMFRAGSGETLKLVVMPRAATELVEGSGWSVTETISIRAAARELVPPESGLPVDAVSEHKSLVAGVSTQP